MTRNVEDALLVLSKRNLCPDDGDVLESPPPPGLKANGQFQDRALDILPFGGKKIRDPP